MFISKQTQGGIAMTWIILGVILIIIILMIVVLYNGIVSQRNLVDEAASQIDVQLQRRADLLPNLLETVKGYAKHERETLATVTQMRAAISDPSASLSDKVKADNQLTGALNHLFAVSENYPDLKANQNFLSLQEELTNTENKVAFSRQNYNSNVMAYNNKLQTFPSNLVSKFGNFPVRDYLEAPEGSKEVPKMKF
ncbi:LemA family protein [Lentilactobacillus hilgardii]|jgi:LemA protein|uniref:LemA family protein n=2 Tax=Lentilactobacillus hilgardii TaxID=1588 RepID=A0A6P1E4W1_LENHI|nr:LemA family protein [Lentilactobacillus buchneri ATCC 11577]EEI72533.1 LemA family protein [Lentilactobacillus hilgardii ATCC 27305]MBZ2202038.1 LemA family protein [Lentilactobacillus hilgardii]RRG11520.1 MAG: LemA family protein [Lactobacillus sp.]MBZ2204842.1 LemA family protein [Lentilactobacillus hilgardii]